MNDAELKAMAEQGLPINMIAVELGVTTSTIYRRLNDLGIRPPGQDRLPLTEAQRKEIAVKRTNGISDYELCKEYGIVRSALWRILLSEGVDVMSLQVEEKQANASRMDLAMKLYEDGAPLWKIQEQAGYSASTVMNEVHKRGIRLRSASRPVKEKRVPKPKSVPEKVTDK